jgi:hypothetical protein
LTFNPAISKFPLDFSLTSSRSALNFFLPLRFALLEEPDVDNGEEGRSSTNIASSDSLTRMELSTSEAGPFNLNPAGAPTRAEV